MSPASVSYTHLDVYKRQPKLTADWEQRLNKVAKGQASPEDFMDGIEAMAAELVRKYSHISEDGQKPVSYTHLKKTAQESKRTALFLKRHWKGALIVGGIGLLLVMAPFWRWYAGW